MRVFNQRKGTKVALHMGRCQPMRATRNHADQVSWSHAGLLMWFVYSSIYLLVNSAMTLQNVCAPAASSHSSVVSWHSSAASSHPSATTSHSSAVLLVAQGHSLSVPKSISVSDSRVFHRNLAPVQRADVLVSCSPPFISALVNTLYTAMLRERPRMGSRCGGSRGRAASERFAPISPSSLVEVAPEQNRPQVSRAGRGRGHGRGRLVECEHAAHPTVCYRIPCTLANSTFLDSVTIENCANLSGQAAAHQAIPREQGTAPPIDTQCPVTGSSSLATQAAPDGPSKLAPGVPTGSVLLLSVSEDSLQFGCRVVEESYTTDDD